MSDTVLKTYTVRLLRTKTGYVEVPITAASDEEANAQADILALDPEGLDWSTDDDPEEPTVDCIRNADDREITLTGGRD